MTRYRTGKALVALVAFGLLAASGFAQSQNRQKDGSQNRIQLPNRSKKQQAQNPKQRLQQIRRKLQQLDKQLTKAQNAALEKEKVQKALEKFTKDRKDEMLRIAPDKSKAIKRRHKVYQDLIALQQGDEAESKKAKKKKQAKLKKTSREYRQLSRQLKKVSKQASASDKVKKSRKAYRKTLIDAMAQENKTVPKLLKQRRQLMRQYRRATLQMRSQMREQKKLQQKQKNRQGGRQGGNRPQK